MTVEEHPAVPEPVVPCVSDSASGEALAWKVHGALQDWTAKVDTKASIVMTLETALLSGIVAFSASRAFTYPLGWASLHRCGLILLFVSIIIAGAVVFPQLRRRDSVKSWNNQLVYFGHLRQWEPTALAEALADRGKTSTC